MPVKIYLIFVLFLFLSCGIRSQIEFQNISFKEALEKAKTESKLVFLDCMTSWCIPCKQADKYLFSDTTVGSYFNARFVSLKIDMEKGEGPELMKKYHVNCFPTLLIVDSAGKIIHYLSIFEGGTKGFLERAKETEAAGRTYADIHEKISGKDYNSSELFQYITLTVAACGDYQSLLADYGRYLPKNEVDLREVYHLFMNYDIARSSGLFQYVLNHFDEIAEIHDRNDLYGRIMTFLSVEVFTILEEQETDVQNRKYFELIQNVKAFPLNLRDSILNDLYINFLARKKMWHELEIYFPLFRDKLTENAIHDFCRSAVFSSRNEKLISLAFPFAQELAAKYPGDCFTQLMLLVYLCHYHLPDLAEFEAFEKKLLKLASRDKDGYQMVEFVTGKLENLRKVHFPG